MSRKEAAVQIFKAMKTRRFTFGHLAKALGQDVMGVNAALIGEDCLPAQQAKLLAEILDLGPEVAIALQKS